MKALKVSKDICEKIGGRWDIHGCVVSKDKVDALKEAISSIRDITHEEWWVISQILFDPIEHYYRVKEKDRVSEILETLKERDRLGVPAPVI